jgi:peptide/nickel transport system substrate-binding protein
MHARLAQPSRWLLLLVALAMVAAACAPGDDDSAAPEGEPAQDSGDAADEPEDERVEGGTILFGDEQEPEILNPYLIDGNALVTTKAVTNILAGAFTITPDFTYQEDVIESAETTEDPFTVTYNIREEAVWSDGEPVSAEDFEFTWQTVMNEDYADQMTSREGYELVTEAAIEDEKTITFTFSEAYAPWQLMFDNVLPAHHLEGEDFLTVWNESIDISAGPFLFDGWTRGQQLRLVRNDAYWGEQPGIDEIVMRYVPDVTTLTQQMRGGEINMFDPQPQVELIDQLDGMTNVEYETVAGAVWEHIDFNTLVEPLGEAYVRQAIIQGINREEIVEALVSPMDPDVQVLQNPIYMPNQDQYQPSYERWQYDPEAARQLLEDNGCAEGDDGIYECEGERLSFRFTTTGGNERRELTQQLVQANLADIGVEIEIDNNEGTEAFLRMDTPENCGGPCDYDLFLFAWVGSAEPQPNVNIYGCDRPQNWTAWCNEEATELMDSARSILDEQERADIWNQAAEIMAEEVPIIPLFQHVDVVAYQDNIRGAVPNPTTATVFWNSQEWHLVE